MSENELMLVPRVEVERLVKLLQYQAHPYPSPHGEFWQGLLDAEPLALPDPSTAAIAFALENTSSEYDCLVFLRLWNEGEFDAIRKEWPEAPEKVFIGADPLYCKKTDSQEIN